jgi:hypothetical protein
MPTTIDEFYNTVVAFRDKDVNKNGQRDEVISASIDNFFTGIAQWYGLGAELITASDGKAVSPWYQPHVRDYLTFMNKLYTAGLLNVNGESTDMAGNKIGYVQQYIAFNTENNIQTPAGSPRPYFAHFILQAAADTQPVIWETGGIQVDFNEFYFVPSGSKNVDKAVHLIDWFVTLEYKLLEMYGILNYTYETDAAGNLTRLLAPKDGTASVGVDNKINGNFMWRGILPWNIDMDRRNETMGAVNNGKNLGYPNGFTLKLDFADQFAAKKWPLIQTIDYVASYATIQEAQRTGELRPDLNTYSSELLSSIIMGEKSLSNWDSYMADLKRLGLDELISIAQARLDRAR